MYLFVGVETFIITYWQIKFKIIEYKALYQTLLASFKIDLSLPKRISIVLTIVSPNAQKTNVETRV